MANPTPPTPTATPGAPTSTLSAIETKVRRLTRSPSTAQLSQSDLDNYINTFLVYDFPEILRTFNLRTEFTFYANPGQDVYPTDVASFGGITTNPLYNFQNLYITVHPPAYIAGYQAFFAQNREQFFNIYPMINSIASIGPTGDGVTTSFTGIVNTNQSILLPGVTQLIALLQNNVLFSSVDVNGNGLALADVPVLNTATGNPTANGNLYDPASAAYQAALQTPPTVINPLNTINYLTGVFTISFTNAPAQGVLINSQTVPQVLSLPQSIMFHNNEFTLRPVPDQPYRVQFEVFQRPSAMLSSGAYPELEEYYQFIAFGAAIKIFQDRMDMDSVNLIWPEFKRQENFVLRRTLVQNSNQRASTIYTEQTSGVGSGFGGWGSGTSGF
jgi:hypothetical protein